MTELTSTPASCAASAPDWRRELREIGVSIGGALAVVLVLHTLVFQPFTIPSSSMEPGLVTGDYIVVSKWPYGWSAASPPFNTVMTEGRIGGTAPRRGDVVVFRLPRDPSQTWIKRIIGLPGDHVRVEGGIVFVNEKALVQTPMGPARDHDDADRVVERAREAMPDGRVHVVYDGGPGEGDEMAERVVPQGVYFVMGDNRDNSLDGRWPGEVGVGWLPAGNIVGRAEWVVASWQPGAALWKPWTWIRLQPGRFLKRIV